VFIVIYRTTDGRRQLRKFTLGTYGALTLVMARAAAQKVLLARLDGKDPAAEKQEKRRRPLGLSVQEVIRPYRLEYLEPRQVGPETTRILDRIVLARWKARQITVIPRTDVRDCVEAIILRGAIGMARRAFKVIGALFKWCLGRGLIETSPCTGLVPPPAGRPRDRVLAGDEPGKVLQTAMTLPPPYGQIVTMLALTGQRRSEVANLRWDELDLAKGIWSITASRTKTRRAHLVHLTRQMIALLPDQEDGQPLVFPSAHGNF
jgi:integrase